MSLGCFRLLSACRGFGIFAESPAGYSWFSLHVEDLGYLQGVQLVVFGSVCM